MSQARDMMETMRLPGWKAYESAVEKEIARRQKEIYEIETVDIESIGTEHLKLAHEIIGMKESLAQATIIRNSDEL